MNVAAIGNEELLEYVIERDFEDTVGRIILETASMFEDGVGRIRLARLLKGRDPGFIICRRPDLIGSFGRLGLLDMDQLLDFMESLLRLGMVELKDNDLPRISVTKLGQKALRRKDQIPVSIPWPLPGKELPAPVDRDAFERIKGERNRIAREEGIPPYCIASNTSLVEMVNRSVRNLSEIASIRGIGETRATRYGERLIQALRSDDLN